MSDLFHGRVPESYVPDVFGVIAVCRQHRFQVLTKRAERLARLAKILPWPANVWIRVSVKTMEYLGRIDYLRRVPAAGRFVSAEPLLGSLGGLNLPDIHWLIAGGESQDGGRQASVGIPREI